MEPVEEFGMYYVRENGTLYMHTENSISSGLRCYKYTKHHNQPLLSATTSSDLLHSCADNIPSLFELCLIYVSSNVQNVDSLVGFPSMIGEKIFAAVRNRRILQTFADRDCASVLQVFDKAYGSLLLEEMSIRSLSVLEQHAESFSAFSHITKLDVTGCMLGDNHDYLLHIGHLSL